MTTYVAPSDEKVFKLTIIYFQRYTLDDSSRESGGRLNKKDGLTRYGNSHVKDKTS